MTPQEKMSHLALSFPSIDKKLNSWPGILPWDACKLVAQYGIASSGERYAISFLLDVWNSGQELAPHFNVIHAMAVWDRYNREAFVKWAQNPFHC